MHILHALKYRYRDQHQSRWYHSMLITQIVHKILGNIYDRLIYKNQYIYLMGCPAHHRFMIYLQKQTLIIQIHDKLKIYDVDLIIKDIRFG